MKRHALFATLMLSALAMQPVLAVDAHHPERHGRPGRGRGAQGAAG